MITEHGILLVLLKNNSYLVVADGNNTYPWKGEGPDEQRDHLCVCACVRSDGAYDVCGVIPVLLQIRSA